MPRTTIVGAIFSNFSVAIPKIALSRWPTNNPGYYRADLAQTRAIILCKRGKAASSSRMVHPVPSLFRRRLGFWWRQLGSIARLGVPVDRAFTVKHQDRCTLCHSLGKGRTFLLAGVHLVVGWYDRWNECLAFFHFSVYLGRLTRPRLSKPKWACAWRFFTRALMTTVLPRPPGGYMCFFPRPASLAGCLSCCPESIFGGPNAPTPEPVKWP